MSEPIFSVLTGKPQSCDQNGNCYFCTSLFRAPRIYGSFTITGAGSVTYTDPYDANNPYNGTFSLNGTYTYNSNYYSWGKDNHRLVMDFMSGQAVIKLAVYPSAENGNSTPPPFDPYFPYSYENLWYAPSDPNANDIENRCVTTTINSSSYAQATPYYAGVVITGSAPTVTWNPNNTNRNICTGGGGIYVGTYHSYYPGAFITAIEEECLKVSVNYTNDVSDCTPASSPGGNYVWYSQYVETGAEGGCCQDGTTCLPYWTDCGDVAGYNLSGSINSCS